MDFNEPVSHSDFEVRPTLIAHSHRVSRAVSVTLALYAIVGGVLTLLGWTFEIRRLTDWTGEGISMFPNTAVCVVLSGIALLLLSGEPLRWRLVVARIVAAIIACVGVVTLIEHFFQINLGFDTLLFDHEWGQRASSSLMRMGPPASSSFLVLGAGLFLATCGPAARRIACMLALGVVAIVSLSLIGYWYGADQLYLLPHITGIAW
ncbi:MAG TPA: hypothetical protein VHU84_14275 [Lacipirellulaceae bacterium]|jgi:hypothetical protein|nr:hypothetical protein [Lacipirellulaceae bacterium]